MSAIISRAIEQKRSRVRTGASLRVLDLFSGCGGISLGFRAAGFDIAAAIELDPAAAKSHGMNFHPGNPKYAVARDITRTTPLQLTQDLGLGAPSQAFDIVVGGPPCQAFARVGRSKLREIADHPEAFRHDARARLYLNYLQYVEACAPLAVLMENVPDMLNHGGHNIAEEVCDVLESRNYRCAYTLLNAAHYGVPQTRERMFLLAYHRSLGLQPSFPSPTHWIALPSGYGGSRAVALKLLAQNTDAPRPMHYVVPPEATSDLPAAITAEDAIKDLPRLDARALLKAGLLRRGARRFDHAIAYAELSERTPYASLMRSWDGFTGNSVLKDHVIRFLPRDFDLFAVLQPGDEYPQAYRRAQELFEDALAKLKESAPKAGSTAWDALRASIVPPYDAAKFPNKWRKMEADQPARTLLAHLGKDSYSHIHYDSTQARTISVREAARLQSFPDGFAFSGTMNPAFRQIGNAVPPLLAKQIATSIKDAITTAVCSAVQATA